MRNRTIIAALAAMAASCTLAPETAAPANESEPVVEAQMSYEATGWPARTLPEIVDALAAGEVSSVALTQAYLDRIAAVDRAGPTLQSVLTINPEALAQAAASDARRAEGRQLGAFDGVPILLKDNIETADPMATTAGALALKENVSGRDSPLVGNLRARGAVILGKTNLSQWANFRSHSSMSGWSALGGQVRNPHILDRNPCGSSSGSGAATAASLAAGTIGTETNGSIICPSNVNGIVGFKPTVGLVSAQYIIPLSPSQDTAGPMTKTVKGAAMLLDAMSMEEGDDSLAAGLNVDALKGKRVGVLRFAQGENADIQRRFNEALAAIGGAGAELVEIDSFTPDAENFWGDALSVLEYEFKHSLNTYLATTPDTVGPRSLAELIAFNEAHGDIELALFNQDIFEESEARGPLTDEAYLSALAAVQHATREAGIDKLLADHDVDMLVAPSGPLSPRIDPVNGDNWPAWAGAGYLAAIAGYPHVTVPMGEVHGVPIGLSIMGAKDDDAAILAYGYAYEQASLLRVAPGYLATAEDQPDIAAAMARKD